MKLLFYFHWDFSYFAHATAIKLKENGLMQDEDFFGIVSHRVHFDYLTKQKEIRYGKLKLIDDYLTPKKIFLENLDMPYLKRIEEEYGIPNLWPFLYADRDICVYNKYAKYTHEETMKFLQSAFKETINFLDETKPDAVFYPVIASLPAYVLYRVAEKKGIKNIILQHTRIGNRYVFSHDTFEGFNGPITSFKNNAVSQECETLASEYLLQYRKRSEKPGYVPTSETEAKNRLKLSNQFKSFLRGAKNHFLYDFSKKENCYLYHGMTLPGLASEHWNINRRIAKTKKEKFDQPQDEEYVFFPLHLQPEMSTNVLAPMYLDQISLIENIAKSLPIGVKLYVKDHPYSVLTGKNNPDSYKRLKNIPNLRLIHPAAPSRQLILGSKGVFVITGTAGLEALLLGKPVITFGRVFFNCLRTVKHLEKINDLPILARQMILNPEYDEKEVIKMIGAILENSFEADLTAMYAVSPVTPEKILKHKDFPTFIQNFLKELDLLSEYH